MEWLLLLYPLFGIGLGIYYAIEYHKYGQSDATGFMVCVMAGFWPVGWHFCAKDIRRFVVEAREQEEREHEALLERVRREDRRRVKQEFAEFDKELGIEPEWKKAHPSAAMEWEEVWDEPLRIPVPHYIDDTRLCDEPQFRVRDLPNYSRGGRV